MGKVIRAEDIHDFLCHLPRQQSSRLLNELDPARVVSLLEFYKWILTVRPIKRVAVISGSENEPELFFLPTARVHYFNFEDSQLWDLNEDWGDGRLAQAGASFDLVLCEQVLEHVLNPIQAVKNASLLLAPGGHLHVSAPGINGTHGEPYYFYGGFHPRTLKAYCAHAGLTSVTSSGWGSKKSVQMYSTCDWSPLAVSAFTDLVRRNPDVVRGYRAGVRHWFRYRRRSFFPAKRYPHFSISWVTAQRG